jgi:hypothetical protein
MSERLRYLQSQYEKATRPVARKLLSDAIAEEQDRLKAEQNGQLETVKQQTSKDLSAAYSDAYAAERDAFQQGRPSGLFKIEHPDLVIDEESVTDSAEDIEKQFHTAKKKFFAWLEEKGIGHRQAAEIHGRWLRINTDVDLRTINGWAASFTFCLQCGIIPPTMIEMEPQEPQARPKPDITELSDGDAKLRLIDDADAEVADAVRPVWEQFIQTLIDNNHYLTTEEQRQILTDSVYGQKATSHGVVPKVTLDVLFRSLKKIRPDFLPAGYKAEQEKWSDLERLPADEWRRKYRIPKGGTQVAFAERKAR